MASRNFKKLCNFNPRSPHRERRLATSTAYQMEYFNPRSPHRERPSLLFRCPNLPYFNPRSPHRERRLSVTIHVHNKVFQSTLPSQGATGLETGEYIVKQISIHAPLTGSDGHEVQMVWRRSYFNPRSPHRERRRREHVVREAYKISIHAPLTGSDPVYGGWTCDADDFNPRSPHRERQICASVFTPEVVISIHAPLTGSDSKYTHKIPL